MQNSDEALVNIKYIDPSELLRPEDEYSKKDIGAFRDYTVDENNPLKERVRVTYLKMHTNQTVKFVEESMQRWLQFNTFKGTIMDTLERLNNLVDESDPDVDIPNIVHAFQTAEAIRADYPQEDWFHLVGLIHDLGKVMAFYGDPQWAVVGDTFPVGCLWADSIVYREVSFRHNSDGQNPKYNTKFGMYKAGCSLKNVLMSWGHDEYLYHVLKHNKCTLPEEGYYMIRYHSFYPWHQSNDYDYLCNQHDLEMKNQVKLFNKYDLYTKSANIPDIEALKPYYQGLIDKYIPGELEW